MSPRLSNIPDNNIAVWCSCGYSHSVPIRPILEKLGDMTVKEAVARMRCSQCGARGAIIHKRIHYVGASEISMAAGHGQRPSEDA